MIRREHTAHCPEEYLTAIGLDPGRVIYFDIETTGFRASTSQLYMIGWAVKAYAPDGEACRTEEEPDSAWTVTQLLTENASEETLLLQLFLDVLRRYDTIAEFNGDRFDLPYLREKYEARGMGDPFEGLRTVDLYQQLRPCRSMLGMTRLNQKSVEQFLHITREDPYSGGELIQVYREVRRRTAGDMDASIRALFLHNYEDVLGMLAMTPVISYSLINKTNAPVSCRLLDADGNPVSASQAAPGSGREAPAEACCLEASYSISVPVPEAFCTDMEYCQIRARGTSVTVAIPLMRGTLYHFFPDYKDYYYLPEEDTAIHKSVACFVDPAYRKQAAARNCYVKKEGIFLPQTDERFLPSFRASYEDRTYWFEFTPRLLEDSGALCAYVHSMTAGMHSTPHIN